MKCPECGIDFVQKTVIQKYCSEICGDRYRRKNRWKMEYPSIKFTCAYPKCGRVVVTEEGSGDRRERFCCASCEKKFWRHPPWEHTTQNINFHSVQEYVSWERRTNE